MKSALSNFAFLTLQPRLSRSTMAASGKMTLRLNQDQASSAERIAQQQLFGVEKTSSQLLMTVASRLHERLAASVSAKLASYDASGQTSVRLGCIQGH